ncbi:hypothetical protein [Rathayibacter toxicus]|uniref:hypothetical protein n=1 Tax=Rathayibacter toxicus TaxID=145458 RepID=UPI001C03C31A|nr:hypothetical protein [Rathayibacter toxicus]QWL30914.1 hypothetical protein E2R34_09280 [Rathayibacter toxicus]
MAIEATRRGGLRTRVVTPTKKAAAVASAELLLVLGFALAFLQLWLKSLHLILARHLSFYFIVARRAASRSPRVGISSGATKRRVGSLDFHRPRASS